MIRKKLFICAALLFVASNGFAQRDSIVIEGRVVNAQGIPLSKAIIKAQHADTGFITHVDGAFSLTLPAKGDSVLFSKEGFADYLDFFCYNYKGVVILDEGMSSWMSYAEYVTAMRDVAKNYYAAGLKFLEGDAENAPDYKKAFVCFTRAANMEYSDAKYQLGRMFDEGLGITQNHTSAAIWYQKSEGKTKALARLGEMYAEGIGVEQDYQKAANYFHEAAEMGDSVYSSSRLEELLSQGLAQRELLPDSRIVDVVEINAQFPAGNQALFSWLAHNVRYPVQAQERGIMGVVVVQFVVNKDGSIVDVHAIKSPSPILSKEAERVVRAMPQWIPASQGGKPVRSRFNLPITFRLS